MKLKFYIIFDTETQTFEVSNAETGETHVSAIKQKTKKPQVEESTDPQLILEDSRYLLNTAAINMMGIKTGDRIDIKFDINGNPIIGTDKNFGTEGTGNLLTKSNTVRYSGTNNAKLAELGKVFFISKDENRNLFILKGDKEPVKDEPVDPCVVEPDDFDLAELLEDEIHGLNFNLN